MEIIDKLYLELAHVASPDTKSFREIAMQDVIDRRGLVLMMIAEGCTDPAGVAQLALSENSETLKARYERPTHNSSEMPTS